MKNKSIRKSIMLATVAFIAAGTVMYNLLSDSKIYERRADELLKTTKNIEVNDEFLNQMSEKELLHYKVINNVDFFRTAEGKFKSCLTEDDYNSNRYKFSDFSVDTEKKLSYYKYTFKTYYSSNEVVHDQNVEVIWNDCVETHFNNSDKTYVKFDESNKSIETINKESEFNYEIVRKLLPKDRYIEDYYGFIRRNDNDFLYYSNEPLNSRSISFGTRNNGFTFDSLLLDYDNWEITSKEKYLDRDAVFISIDVKIDENDTYDKNYVPLKIDAVIDKETGIILKYSMLNEEDKVIRYMETTSLDIDKDIDSVVFEKSIDGYDKDMR